MDKVRLVVEAAFVCELAPVDRLSCFRLQNCLLETHDPEILLGGHTHLFAEQVNEMFL